MRFHSPNMAAWLLTTGLCGPIALGAQAPAVKPDRPDCAQTATTFATLNAGNEFKQAASDLTTCRDAGPRALAAKWDQLPSDSVAVGYLADISRNINDLRLLSAIKRVVLQTSNSERVRLLALTALVGQYDPSTSISFHPRSKRYPEVGPILSWGMIDGPGTYGAQPVGADARADILSTLRQLRGSDPNDGIRKAAQDILTHLAAGT